MVDLETNRDETTLDMKNSIVCVRFVTVTVSLTDECNCMSSLTASTGVAVRDTIRDNGTTGDRGQFLVEV